jgi:hypothetical protein
MSSKVCRPCGRDLPFDSFYTSRTENKLMSNCKECCASYGRAWIAAMPDVAAYYRRNNLKKFGITPEQYDEMMEAQEGVCALCGGIDSDRRLCIDHDHSCCGAKRACDLCRGLLLCTSCNLILGKASDDAALLRRAADYLEAHRGRS